MADFNAVEPRMEEEITLAFDFIEKEYPEEWHTKLKKFVEKLSNRHLHLSREHLKAVLRNVVSSESHV